MRSKQATSNDQQQQQMKKKKREGREVMHGETL
jgi:hypothetical protein